MMTFKQIILHPLYPYDKAKVNWLKAIFPIVIIVHHISNLGYTGLDFSHGIDAKIMPIFFAMSGFGLVICYRNRDNYINGFLKRSLTKLFIPYLIALLCFVFYRELEGLNQIELLKEEGIMSFVPTSWFIWTLAYFYVFFFFVFRYSKASLGVKVALVCALVIVYTLIANQFDMSYWRYRSNPGFCMGMLFAFFDEKTKRKFVRWQAILALCLVLAIIRLPIPSRLLLYLYPYLYPIALFLLMYILSSVKENVLVKFLSSISLEMFIIQFIPIYIMMNDFHVKSTIEMVLLVLSLDIILAYIMHLIVQKISARLR